MSAEKKAKKVAWVGSSLKDLQAMPAPVKDEIGHALFVAQIGGKHENATPMKGFTGASCVAIKEDFDGNTYRAIYTATLGERLYVLHCFQKKSKNGIATAQHDIELIKARLKIAQEAEKKAEKAKPKAKPSSR